jgi:nitrogen regulatory protein PII 2
MREGIIAPKFADKFFRIDFEASPMPVLSLYPIPSPQELDAVRLDVCGLEQHPRLISWPMLEDLPRIKLKVPLTCQIFNWFEVVEWEGIRVVDLLDFLKIDTHPEGYFAFYSRDRVFFEGLSRDEARDPRVLLAYGLNGAPLPENHGGPLRLVVPFLQGYKSVKWVGTIQAFRHDPIGIKRLLGQSPSGNLNEMWRGRHQIVPPAGKTGDPSLLPSVPAVPAAAPAGAPIEGTAPSQRVSLPPAVGEIASIKKRKGPQIGILKEIVAIIRPEKHPATRQALEAAGIYSYTVTSVLGRSRQRGLKFQSEGKEGVAIKFLPKQLFSIVVDGREVDTAIGAIIKANRSGKGSFGDGKIFVIDIDDAVRMSTDERGMEAIS